MARKKPDVVTERQKQTIESLKRAGLNVRKPRTNVVPKAGRIPGLREALKETRGK